MTAEEIVKRIVEIVKDSTDEGAELDSDGAADRDLAAFDSIVDLLSNEGRLEG